MNFLSKVFKCMPSTDEANYTMAYVASITKKPQLFSSTVIGEPDQVKLEEDKVEKKYQCSNRKTLKELIVEFMEKRTGQVKDASIKQMYTVILDCFNDRVGLHVWSIMNSPMIAEDDVNLEEILKKNYISMLRQPEWDVEWSKRLDLTDHPNFTSFFKCQLKSDYLYSNNSHELFMRMHCYLQKLINDSPSKNSGSYCQMLHSMRENFDEFVARDLLVLCYSHDRKKATMKFEKYLLAKYNMEDYEKIPDDFNKTSSHFDDFDIKNHPFYVEYITSKFLLEEKYEFKYDPHFSCYKQAAEDWIYYRQNVGVEKLPDVVNAMYITLENNLSSQRAFELFIVCQYRMNNGKVQRMEAYLSEKYRPFFSTVILDKVFASYPETPEPSFFSENFPNIQEGISRSNMINPVYTKDMIDKVTEMLVSKKTIFKRFTHKYSPKRVKRCKKLLDFLYNRPNEERTRELYAMIYCDMLNWEDAFYKKYEESIKLLKNFERVESYSIF